jgi:hypothetical protein
MAMKESKKLVLIGAGRIAKVHTRSVLSLEGVAFKINWRSVSELFGVMFQDYLAYTASACADHKTVPRRFNYFIGDEVKVVNSENPFNLGEESS